MSQLNDAQALELAEDKLAAIRKVVEEFIPNVYDEEVPKETVANYALFTLGQIAGLLITDDPSK